MPFESRLWSACGDILVHKLVKPKQRARDWEASAEQAHAAMERVVRLVRAGHLGKLVFEEPQTKPHKEQMTRSAIRTKLQATSAAASAVLT